jgi:ABC-2 type transport system permease protein
MAAIVRAPLNVFTLARYRLAQLRNLVDQQLTDAPGRTLVTLVLMLLIWAALYFLLTTILTAVQRWGVVSVVVLQYIFVHFFLVLAVMLAFSNAVLGFGSLFGRSEAGHLLSMPIDSVQVVAVKWLEGLFLSSWSFLLLGVPLMLAIAAQSRVSWYYYPLFIGHFIGFVIIPANIGLLAAWAVAMWAPRRPAATAIWLGSVLLILAILWLSNISHQAVESGEWLRIVMQQAAVAKQIWLPSTWTAKGVVAATEHRIWESCQYLLIVLGNSTFISWLTINVIGWKWGEAYNRAQQGRFSPTIRRGWFTAAVNGLLFFYLPRPLRAVMLKDLRGFARDAKQWTQMVIMFGLLIVYVLNLTRLPLDISNPGMRALIAFLNLVVISLILATLTSRFVYPLLSLESQQLWLLGLLPTGRNSLLLIKFVFALTITGLSALIVMAMAVNVLGLPPAWARLHLLICASVCIGLCGLSVGLGARFPVLRQRNPARIASGFGGTFNLIASMVFVFLQMTGVALLSFEEFRVAALTQSQLPETLSPRSVLLAGGLLLFSFLVAGAALWIGGRHFERLES